MKKEIVEAKLDHIYIIEELEKKNFSKAWTSMNIEEDMLHDFSSFRMIRLDDEYVGYMNFWVIDNSLELNRICINEEYRNQGLARVLMDDLVNTVEQNDLERSILEVSSENVEAKKLYESYGFEKIHVREKYYEDGSDAIIMVRLTNEY